MKEGLKPSLATTHAKASRRVIADPLGLGKEDDGRVARHLFSPAFVAKLRALTLNARGQREHIRRP